MNAWWDSLTTLTKFFYFFAIPSTVILLIQSALTLIGIGADGGDMDFDSDIDGDFDADFDMDIEPEFDIDGEGIEDFEALSGVAGFRFITIRGIIAFLTMFGWVGVVCSEAGLPLLLTFFLAILAGLGSMFIIALLFYGISKLQSSGNINYRKAIGKEATVYIPIPAQKDGFGKIQLTLADRLIEVNAVTDEEEMIGTGKMVRIIDMLNPTTFVVERSK